MPDPAQGDKTPAEAPPPVSLRALALLFFRLGATAFGGPAVHIAMMEEEVVRRRRWLSREQFLDLLGATHLIPGPNSTEMAIHIGRMLAGRPGYLVAGTCFILPAVVIVTLLACAYVHFKTLPQATAILYAIKPVVIAVIVQALWRLGRACMRTTFLAIVGLAATVLAALGVNELVVLFGCGAFVVVCRWLFRRRQHQSPAFPLAVGICAPVSSLVPLSAAGGTAVGAPFGLWPLFLFFLKVGSVLFGSGYVLVAFLRADLVERWGWLTEQELLDAVAVGQVTPGPVFTTATFIGYQLGGIWGAVVATVGIFLPAFFFVAVTAPWVPRLRQAPTAGAFLDGVNVASLALMAVVTWQLGRAALVDYTTVGLATASTILLLGFRVNATYLILGSALLGLILSLVQGG